MESPSGFSVSILFLVSILRGALIGQFPTRRGQYHTEQRRFVNFKKSASLILSIFIVKKQNMIDLSMRTIVSLLYHGLHQRFCEIVNSCNSEI